MTAIKAFFKKWSFPKKENNNLMIYALLHFRYYLYAVGTADLKGKDYLKPQNTPDILPSSLDSLIA